MSDDDDPYGAYGERMAKVKKALARNGGVIKPWMRYALTLRDLRMLWVSGDWIEDVSNSDPEGGRAKGG